MRVAHAALFLPHGSWLCIGRALLLLATVCFSSKGFCLWLGRQTVVELAGVVVYALIKEVAEPLLRLPAVFPSQRNFFLIVVCHFFFLLSFFNNCLLNGIEAAS